MKKRMQQIRGFLADVRGGETIEYALILGLVIVTAIAVIGAVGTRVVARWTTVNSSSM
jgi:Flp pilus assembly pilin Flp